MTMLLANIKLRTLNVTRPVPGYILLRVERAKQNLVAGVEFEIGTDMAGPAEGEIPEIGLSNVYYIWPTMRLQLTAPESTIEGVAPDEVIWSVAVTLEVEYHLGANEPGLAQGDAMQRILPHVQYQTWPYFREVIGNMATRGGVPAPMLPILLVHVQQNSIDQP